MTAFEHLLRPITLGKLQVKNRVMVTAHTKPSGMGIKSVGKFE